MANLIGKKSTVTEYQISLNKEEFLLILTMLDSAIPSSAIAQYDSCYTEDGTGAYLTRAEFYSLLCYSGEQKVSAGNLYIQLENMLEK